MYEAGTPPFWVPVFNAGEMPSSKWLMILWGHELFVNELWLQAKAQ
jgi:hypothetical protein